MQAGCRKQSANAGRISENKQTDLTTPRLPYKKGECTWAMCPFWRAKIVSKPDPIPSFVEGMVCEKCQKKLTKVACPDKWKEGANNTIESGGRKINENKLLSKKNRWSPYTVTSKCKICKSVLHQEGKYCQNCAYSKGFCAMCGKQVLDTSKYKQSNR